MGSRRHFLGLCAGAVGTSVGGCLATSGSPAAPTDTPTAPEESPCPPRAPPAPTDAATEPRPYPDRPAIRTVATVEEWLGAYERAFQYNDALAANPRKVGRTNEITVTIQSVSVTAEDGAFRATVSGTFRSDLIDRDATTTSATPTETPLPMGYGPIEADYTVTERWLRREGVVRECW